jgi:predicted outer membrane repeat protein
MRRTRTIIQALIGATVIAGGMAALTPAAWADTIPVACSENALVAAITLANSTPAADTLVLAGGCTYTLTSAHGGPTDGLPVITTPIEMIGPATITRANSAPSFRIAEVSPTGSLTLTTGVALTNGSAAGDGGAILNHGAVTLTNSSLSDNTATGNGGGLANADTPSGTAPAATFTRSPVSNNTAGTNGGGIYNGQRGTLTTTGVSGSPLIITGNTATGTLLGLFGGGRGGGIAAVDSTATTLTQTAVTNNHAGGLLGLGGTAGGVYRLNGTMTTTSSPITANTPNNCVGSSPAVPTCTG